MFIEKSKKEEMGSLNSFLWWGIVLLSIIDKIELRKLIDIDKVNYKFPCGSVQCEVGIILGMVLLNVKRRLASKRNEVDSLCIDPFFICGRRYCIIFI